MKTIKKVCDKVNEFFQSKKGVIFFSILMGVAANAHYKDNEILIGNLILVYTIVYYFGMSYFVKSNNDSDIWLNAYDLQIPISKTLRKRFRSELNSEALIDLEKNPSISVLKSKHDVLVYMLQNQNSVITKELFNEVVDKYTFRDFISNNIFIIYEDNEDIYSMRTIKRKDLING